MFIEKTFAIWCIDSNKNTVQVQTPYGKTCTPVTKSFIKALYISFPSPADSERFSGLGVACYILAC